MSIQNNRLNDDSLTIFEACKNIKEKKYIIPAFQRQYVWSIEQIEKLWDSILIGYPISTFLFWKLDKNNTERDMAFCQFRDNIQFSSKKQAANRNYDLTTIDLSITDTAILDGQQRLTSLYLSLFGNAYIKRKYQQTNGGTVADIFIELDETRKNAINEDEFNEKRYGIVFSDRVARTSPTQFKLRDILSEKFQNPKTREDAFEEVVRNIQPKSKEYALKTIRELYNKIFIEKNIRFIQMDNIGLDDALEMFVRFNNGGKPLKKSEITTSIIQVYWPDAKSKFANLLQTSKYTRFDFDFLVRAALMLFGDVVKSTITKSVVENLRNNWEKFETSLICLTTVLEDMKIDIERFYDQWNILLPVLYVIYYNKDDYNKIKNNKNGFRAYLVRASLFQYFRSGGTTGKLQQLRTYINNYNYEMTIDMLNQMSDLSVTDGKIDDIINTAYGDPTAENALYFLNAQYVKDMPSYDLDHLHPRAAFEYPPVDISTDKWKEWRIKKDRLPNLELLDTHNNIKKTNKRLIDFCNNMTNEQLKEYKKVVYIPDEVSLDIRDFENFYNERAKVLAVEIKNLMN